MVVVALYRMICLVHDIKEKCTALIQNYLDWKCNRVSFFSIVISFLEKEDKIAKYEDQRKIYA